MLYGCHVTFDDELREDATKVHLRGAHRLLTSFITAATESITHTVNEPFSRTSFLIGPAGYWKPPKTTRAVTVHFWSCLIGSVPDRRVGGGRT